MECEGAGGELTVVLELRYNVYKDHITLEDYEIHDGMNLELYYQ